VEEELFSSALPVDEVQAVKMFIEFLYWLLLESKQTETYILLSLVKHSSFQ
jgi:hypothetical protein